MSYSSVTELSGDEVTQEQIDRLYNRYCWAGAYCRDKDVLEVACGAGIGLGYLQKIAASLKAGDIDEEILAIPKSYYGKKIALKAFDALNIPFPDHCFDVILLFEAIYYLKNAARFIEECNRLLRKGGKVLIATANKDLYDFNPSPYSHQYYGVVELKALFDRFGYSTTFFGYLSVDQVTLIQKMTRPVKAAVVKLGLMPRSMKGKKLIKRLIFGKMIKMPYELEEGMCDYIEPDPVVSGQADTSHKVIYCVATKANN